MNTIRLRQSPQLPSLYETIDVTGITNMEQFRKWDFQRKLAYRSELDNEIREKTKSKDRVRFEKSLQKIQIAALAQNEKKKQQQEKYQKVKTEQRYMADNFKMMKNSARYQRESTNASEGRDHPFIKLVDEQDRRAQQTKHHFIFQNQLNTIQTEMKQQIAYKTKRLERQQRKVFEDHIEQQYLKKKAERKLFEQKYLKSSLEGGDIKRQYLEYLKRQAQNQKKIKPSINSVHRSQMSRYSPGSIGMLPVSPERLQQLKKVDRHFKPTTQLENKSLQHSLQLKKQPKQFNLRKNGAQKNFTEIDIIDKMIPSNEKIKQYQKKIRNIEQKEQANENLKKKYFRQFDIILGKQRKIYSEMK